MARRSAGRRGAGSSWAIVVLLIVGVAALWWYLSARRAEAPSPPPTVPGARALREAPSEDIRQPDKQELERVLRERGGAHQP